MLAKFGPQEPSGGCGYLVVPETLAQEEWNKEFGPRADNSMPGPDAGKTDHRPEARRRVAAGQMPAIAIPVSVPSIPTGLPRSGKPSSPGTERGRAIDDDRKDLIGHIFAIATARLETAHEVAVKGQAPDRDMAAVQATAGRLRGNRRKIITLADTASLLACEDDYSGPDNDPS